MAEAAAATAAAPLIIEGVEKGEEKAKAVYAHVVDTMTRSLETYDYEKVAFQGFTVTAVFMLGKLLWHLYVQLKLAAFTLAHPDFALLDIMQGIPFLGNLITIVGGAVGEEEAAAAAFDAEVLSDPAVKYGKPVFETYWLLIILGLWVLLALNESRRVKSLGSKRRRLMKLVSRV